MSQIAALGRLAALHNLLPASSRTLLTLLCRLNLLLALGFPRHGMKPSLLEAEGQAEVSAFICRPSLSDWSRPLSLHNTLSPSPVSASKVRAAI